MLFDAMDLLFEVAFKLVADNRDIFHIFPEPLEKRIDNLLDPTYSRNLLTLNIVKGDCVFLALWAI